MARIGAETLQQLGGLLVRLRLLDGLTEKSPGVFYSRRIPMLHFHEGEGGPVADLKRLPPESGFDRFDAASNTAQTALLTEVTRRVGQLQRKGAT
ncbi:MAG: hypothetical protein JNN20_20285 [Betaproteobacteria bacterium]|nr:hypothetical protein [Betaproteobacteria bacterium]